MPLQQHQATGLEYLDLATQLLRRIRRADPTAGLWEAADLHWWWRTRRPSDQVGQTFWLDDSGPVAAVIFTDWRRTWGCDPILGLGSSGPSPAVVWSHALAGIDSLDLDRVEVAVRDDQPEMSDLVVAAGFSTTGARGAATWMLPADRPRVPVLAEGFRLWDREQTPSRRHHLADRNGPHVGQRLAQTSTYRRDLDLLVEAPNGDVAAMGVFWFDPVTGVGLVEPMATSENYRRLGLARFVLATGLDRLAALGAQRLKVNYEVDNEASQNLYLGAGFGPESTAQVFARRGRPGHSSR